MSAGNPSTLKPLEKIIVSIDNKASRRFITRLRPLILALVILAGGIPAHADVTGKPRVIVGDTIEIAVCYAGGYDLNAKMVRRDWALAYRRYPIECQVARLRTWMESNSLNVTIDTMMIRIMPTRW